ncbi:hypothetical protein HID58_041361 [Brassica napus]|uniref:Uncharacterized protein n=1 Tax=Brassica napus TaxID=3708 RepID=A0ABQ8BAV8_BRANA|nr:hypothetical protein HID58_041361 [Brassica napus]
MKIRNTKQRQLYFIKKQINFCMIKQEKYQKILVVYGASVAYVVVDYFTFNSLRLGRAAQSVVGRLIHFWDSRNINKNEEFMGIMILLDELDYVIHGFPNNLELMMGLFNCYVREYSFMKQQQTAIKMYKLAGEERFLLWAVCSIKLQVLCDRSGEKLLLLPEGLLKLIASHITVSRLNPLTVCAGANCIQF